MPRGFENLPLRLKVEAVEARHAARHAVATNGTSEKEIKAWFGNLRGGHVEALDDLQQGEEVRALSL